MKGISFDGRVFKKIFRMGGHSPMPFFFLIWVLSQTFMNHKTAGDGGGHFINSSLPLPPASQTLRH